jgi:hypothetical protein
MNRFVALGAIAVAVGCGGQTGDGSGGSGGAAGGSGGATGGSGGVGGGTGGATGGSGGATGGSGGVAGGVGGATGGTGNVGGATGTPCNPSAVLCKSMPPDCAPGEVPSVVGSCWGPCVPILSCATEPNCDDCQNGFCAAYQSFTTEYRCVLPSLQCQALACSCLAQYFCVDPYSACTTQSGSNPPITCECPTC